MKRFLISSKVMKYKSWFVLQAKLCSSCVVVIVAAETVFGAVVAATVIITIVFVYYCLLVGWYFFITHDTLEVNEFWSFKVASAASASQLLMS